MTRVQVIQWAYRVMKNKKKTLEGTFDHPMENQIYLNINHLKDGIYVLKIIYKNKVIKETTFKK